MSESDANDPGRATKYHEGWVYHQGASSKTWNKFWLVLRGSMLFIFDNENTSKCEMLGTLSLGPSTQVINLPSDSKKKGFKFELITPSRNGEKKANKLKFNTEIEKDLWKSFIMGIGVGIVPNDIHLLPGQLKDVHEAMGEVRNTPPPLPTLPRPNLPHPPTIPRPQIQREDDDVFLNETLGVHKSLQGHRGESSVRSDSSGGSGDSGAFQGHLTMAGPSKREAPRDISLSSTEGGTINNLRELQRRQSEVALRDLFSSGDSSRRGETSVPVRSPPPPMSAHTIASPNRQNSHNNSSPLPRTPSYNQEREHVSATMHKSTSYEDHSFTYHDQHRRVSVGSPREMTNPVFPSTTGGAPGRRPSFDSGSVSHESNINNHPFYLSAERNKETPTWFFENCAREDAEGLLTVGRKFGNVLLRPSLSNTSSGKYVISMRREVSGGTQLNHYVVVPCGNGYKIDVDNEHHPMKCLSDVMDFFVSVAGPGTNPFKTNNLSKIYGTGFDAPIGSGPRPSSDTSSSISQGSQQTSSSTWNRPAPSPPAWNHNQSPTFPNNGNGSFNPNKEKESSLFTKGQVDSALKQAVQEINESLAPAPPPPPAPKQTASWGPPVEYGNIDEYGEDNDMLHTPVPVRQPPADTIIRNIHPANSVPEGMSNRYMSDQGYDPQPYATRTAAYNDPHSQPYGTSRLSYQHPPSPPAPPPPPPMPGQFGGSNNIPAPPPISTMPSNAMRRNSEPNSPGQGMLHRQSSRGGGRPGGAGQTPVLSFEEELQSRLKPKREQIYAHANILRSNYNS